MDWTEDLVIEKDSDAVLDWKFDWTSWLSTSETITSYTMTVDAGLTKDSASITDSGKSVTVWLSGGTVNTRYVVSCLITTSTTPARTDERSVTFKIVNK